MYRIIFDLTDGRYESTGKTTPTLTPKTIDLLLYVTLFDIIDLNNEPFIELYSTFSV